MIALFWPRQREERELWVASATILFQELLFIRWIGTEVRVLAYFPNLLLLAAFLGLGLGCLAVNGKPWAPFWPWLLAAVTLATAGLSRVVFTAEGASEHLWLLYYDLPPTAPVVPHIAPALAIAFVLTALAFVPLGQYVAERLRGFQARGETLRGYFWELAGSLGGVVLFGLATAAGLPPAGGFLVLAGLSFFLRPPTRARWTVAVPVALALFVAHRDRTEIHTPYYALRTHASPSGHGAFEVLANGALHQMALPVRRSDAPAASFLRRARDGYQSPYDLLRRAPRRALVLGAGTGNDVAVLLDRGAESIDAVEIDPGILRLGERHPDRPYASPRVRVINADGRAFLHRSTGTYDLIVLGTLDSMTRLSALSNVRLDNFIYTRESLAAIHRRLSPDGGLLMYFMISQPFIDGRLMDLLKNEFGRRPLARAEDDGVFNRIFAAGPAFDHVGGALRDAPGNAPVSIPPTDDWPYLYLRERGIPVHYGLAALLVVLSAILGGLCIGGREVLRARPTRSDGALALFGMGFLLLETRSVTSLNLLWSTTWITSTVVFGAILLTGLLSTAVARKAAPPWTFAATALLAALAITYFCPLEWFLGWSPVPKALASLVLVGLPIFFAGLVFAEFFEDHPFSPRGFAWNLLGAVAGGLLEFLSMALGFRALVLLAGAVYLTAFAIRPRRRGVPR
jgi:SAM-dependent methyltransferase